MSVPIQQIYAFCPRCGAKHDEVGQTPFRCTQCEFTQFFGPVAAVGGLIVDDQNRLLLVRRARDPGKGKWGLPGGFVDRGETIEQALRREVTEETNLQLASMKFLFTSPNRYDYRGVVSSVIDVFYVCRAEAAENIKLEEKELDRYEWVVPDATYLNDMAFPSNRRAVEFWMERQCQS